jgi:NADH-quinone oxidoreductase subunit M
MILLLLVLVPIITGIACVLAKDAAKSVALVGALVALALSAYAAMNVGAVEAVQYDWMPAIGAQFAFQLDGLAAMLCLLTGVLFPVILLLQHQKPIHNAHTYYALIMLSQAGLMGVFLASDALLFYFFWELALIPVYFLCSSWGGERRIAVTYKFFVYTFVGSLFMLAALIYLSLQTNGSASMSWSNIIAAGKSLPETQQHIVFWMMFIAFAIKMPIFPFHTWQPDAYEQSPTQVTIILSALMVKMGLFGVIRWLQPALPEATMYWSDVIIVLSIIGIVYASLIAMKQSNIKRLIAFSSIAHMGLMCAVAFAGTEIGKQGVMVQMFNHGINIAAMWFIVHMVEQRYHTQDLSKMGGLATTAPVITIALVIVAFANIALPLTNGFVGEFMLFTGLFQSPSPYHVVYMVIAGLGIILGAVYTLTMVQKVAYGTPSEGIAQVEGMSMAEQIGILVMVILILVLGVYPTPLINLVMA